MAARGPGGRGQPPATAYSARQNEYFVPRDGIDREVIQADICRYLGNDALVKPGWHEQTQGYYITAYRNLTTAMIQDLKADSERWDIERRRSALRGEYIKSETYHRRQVPMPSDEQRDSYLQSQGQPAYTSNNSYPAQAGGAYQNYGYTGGYQQPSGGSYPAGYPASTYADTQRGYPQYAGQTQQDYPAHSGDDGMDYDMTEPSRPTAYPAGEMPYIGVEANRTVYQPPNTSNVPRSAAGGDYPGPKMHRDPRDPYVRGDVRDTYARPGQMDTMQPSSSSQGVYGTNTNPGAYTGYPAGSGVGSNPTIGAMDTRTMQPQAAAGYAEVPMPMDHAWGRSPGGSNNRIKAAAPAGMDSSKPVPPQPSGTPTNAGPENPAGKYDSSRNPIGRPTATSPPAGTIPASSRPEYAPRASDRDRERVSDRDRERDRGDRDRERHRDEQRHGKRSHR